MQIHQLQVKHKNKNQKRVGRGGKKGTYSGRGGKGQTARSGRKMVPVIRELIKRYPKLKGYRAYSTKEMVAVVGLDMIEKSFQDGQVVSPATLVEKKMVQSIGGKVPVVKILSNGTLSKKVLVEGCKISQSAKEAIEKVGGSIK